MTTPTQEVGFVDKFKSAIALIESFGSIVVKTALDHKSADDKLKQAREYRAQLKKEYDENPIVIKAKEFQATKVKLDADLEKFVKDLKNGPMLVYERAEEQKRIDEENRLARIAQEAQDKENARLAAIAKKEQEKAEKEAKRLEEIAAAKAAAQKKIDDAEYARLRAEGDAKAAAAAKKAAIIAAHDAKVLAETAATEARIRAEAAAIEQQRIKDEAAAAPKVVVVLEKTAPTTANRRMIPKFRITDESKIPHHFFTRDDAKIGGVIRSLKANHGIPGVEYYEENA